MMNWRYCQAYNVFCIDEYLEAIGTHAKRQNVKLHMQGFSKRAL
jgi:hypothetical protein